MFERISTGWQFAKDSYSIVVHNKRLIVLPIVSMIAAAAVLASFAVPLWTTGVIEAWFSEAGASDGGATQVAGMPLTFWLALLAFYFCSTFVIVFFNCALIACTMQALEGNGVRLRYGLAMASKRIPQILGWSLVSAVIGVVLKAIESNEKASRFIAGLLGMAWTVMTYFAVPFIVMQGLGPVGAVRESMRALRKTWGESLVGHFSLGFIGFLIGIPIFILGGIGIYFAVQSGSMALIVAAAVALGLALFLAAAASSAADIIFKALLYTYATGKSLPENVDASMYDAAFGAAD